MNENLITELKGQKNLPRWFSSVFNMIKNPDQGGLLIELTDGRKFLVQSKKEGSQAKIIVRNEKPPKE